MSLRSYLLIMSAMTAFCWLAFGYIIWTVDPETTNGAGFFLFYLSLLFSLIGSSAVIGFIIRFIFLRHELIINQVLIAFRQSFMFSGFIIAMLILQARGMLTWLNAVILIVGLSALEFFLLSYRKTSVIARSDSDEETFVMPASEPASRVKRSE